MSSLLTSAPDRDSIEKLIERIYTTPAGAVRNALVTLLAVQEGLASAIKSRP